MEGSDYLKALLQRISLVQNHFSPEMVPSVPLQSYLSQNENEPLVKISQAPQAYISPQGRRTLREELIAHQKAIDQLTLMVDNSKTTRKISRSPNLNVSISHLEESQKKKQEKEIQIKSTDREVLIVVREKLKEIVQFLTKKIDIPRIVQMSDVRESLNASNVQIQKPSKNDESNLLRLPRKNEQKGNQKEQAQRATIKNESIGRDHLNLKHSFDKLNEIHSTNSLFQHQQQRHNIESKINFIPQLRQVQSIYSPSMYPVNNQKYAIKPNIRFQNPVPQMRISQRPFSESMVRNPNYSPEIRIIRPPQFQQIPNRYQPNIPQNIVHQPIIQRNPIQITPNYNQLQRPNLIQRPPTIRSMNPQPQPLSTDRTRLYHQQLGYNIISQPNIPIRYPQPRLILPNQIENLSHNRSRQRQYLSTNKPEIRKHPHLQSNLRVIQRSQSQVRLKRKSSKHQSNFDKKSNKSINQPQQQVTRSIIKNIYQQKAPLFDLQAPKPYTNFSQNRQNPFESNRLYDSSKMLKSSVLKTDKILKPIAQKSQQNIVSRKISSSKSSERLMSEVSEKTIYFSNFTKEGAGSTKLKRKGIQLSMKRAYMTQYRKQQ